MTIDGVRDVTLFTDALAGWRQPSVNLTVTGAQTCAVASSAFPDGSSLRSVLLNNITSLSLDRSSFASAIDWLELRNVSISYGCRADTFSGRLGRLTLRAASLERISPGCFRSGHRWRRLLVLASRLGAVPQRAFTGHVEEVHIEDTKLANLAAGAVEMNVTSFSLERCDIGRVSGRALRILAEAAITVSSCNISRLEEGALLGLRAANSSGQWVTVRRLAVAEAAGGSLRLHSGPRTALSEVQLGEQCECASAGQRAAHLALGDLPATENSSAHRPQARWLQRLTEPQLEGARQTALAVSCWQGETRTLLAELVCRACSEAGTGEMDRLLRCPAPLPAASRRWMLWPFMFIVALLVLSAGCGPLLMIRRCRPPGSSRQPPEKAAVLGQPAALEAGSSTAGHLSWRVVGELEPEPSGELEPEPSREPGRPVVATARPRHVSWRVVGELEPESTEYGGSVCTSSLASSDRRLAGSDSGGVFQSLRSIPEPVEEPQAELWLKAGYSEPVEEPQTELWLRAGYSERAREASDEEEDVFTPPPPADVRTRQRSPQRVSPAEDYPQEQSPHSPLSGETVEAGNLSSPRQEPEELEALTQNIVVSTPRLPWTRRGSEDAGSSHLQGSEELCRPASGRFHVSGHEQNQSLPNHRRAVAAEEPFYDEIEVTPHPSS